MQDNYLSFVSQLNDVCREYPNLRIKTSEDGKQYLKGIIDISIAEQANTRSYLIEIHFAKGFPYRFPKLYEVGGDIPCEADFHKYPDDSCCITVYDFLECVNGITVLTFVKEQVIPYLANQWYRQVTGKFKNEYSHGNKGRIEYLCDIAFGEKKSNLGRNDKCFCGSNKKYKKCCQTIIDTIKRIGKERMLQFINLI